MEQLLRKVDKIKVVWTAHVTLHSFSEYSRKFNRCYYINMYIQCIKPSTYGKAYFLDQELDCFQGCPTW